MPAGVAPGLLAVPAPRRNPRLSGGHRMAVKWVRINETWYKSPVRRSSFAQRPGEPAPRMAGQVLVDPEESVEVAFVADSPGDWLFHCHILEHMEAGMFATLRVA